MGVYQAKLGLYSESRKWAFHIFDLSGVLGGGKGLGIGPFLLFVCRMFFGIFVKRGQLNRGHDMEVVVSHASID
tara:strand:- start:9 stop:230 length:222 start_codon:yes stop_codon:yes gene_type:complete